MNPEGFLKRVDQNELRFFEIFIKLVVRDAIWPPSRVEALEKLDGTCFSLISLALLADLGDVSLGGQRTDVDFCVAKGVRVIHPGHLVYLLPRWPLCVRRGFFVHFEWVGSLPQIVAFLCTICSINLCGSLLPPTRFRPCVWRLGNRGDLIVIQQVWLMLIILSIRRSDMPTCQLCNNIFFLILNPNASILTRDGPSLLSSTLTTEAFAAIVAVNIELVIDHHEVTWVLIARRQIRAYGDQGLPLLSYCRQIRF